MKRLLIASILPLLTAAAPTGNGAIAISVEGLRNQKGVLQVCVTGNAAFFPNCEKDPNSRRLTVPVKDAAHISVDHLPAGTYAVSMIHDENSDKKLNTMMGIPREGIGFSRNPTLRFSAPKFADTSFAVGDAPVTQKIRLKYFL